jgi:predicted ATPase
MSSKNPKLALSSVRVHNFKAIRNSKAVKFTPLTVFIGDNGSGKSSLFEALETMQIMSDQGLDAAMNRWRGFEFIWNQSARMNAKTYLTPDSRVLYRNPIVFEINGHLQERNYRAKSEISLELRNKTTNILISYESTRVGSEKLGFVIMERHWHGDVDVINRKGEYFENMGEWHFTEGESALSRGLGNFLEEWQFVLLAPETMGVPTLQKRTAGAIKLARDGSNIADYLRDIFSKDPIAFEGIIEAFKEVVPFARDLQTQVAQELQRTVYLEMTEGKFKIPGWMLSTGTIRVLAIIALLRHPTPPPIIFIEELENGLDPRTLNLVVEEIRRAVELERTQVVITTHSPYLLDLLSLSQIVVVERVDGEPVFTRPADHESLKAWLEKFSPGQLYTMGRLRGVKS